MSRQKDPFYFLLETSITNEHGAILGSKLPTVKQVLISFVANHRSLLSEEGPENSQKLLHRAATITIRNQVLPIYDKARIPTKEERNMVGEILKIYKKMLKLKKIREHLRDHHPHIKSFKEGLEKTMVFWGKDVEEKILSRRDPSKEEDLLFLKDQKNERKYTIGGVDKKLAKSEENTSKRKVAELRKVQKENDRKTAATIDNSSQFHKSDEDDHDDNDKIYEENSRKHRRLKKTGISVFIPHNILKDKKIVSTAIRNNISPTSVSAIVQSVIEACHGDSTKVTLSYTQAYR